MLRLEEVSLWAGDQVLLEAATLHLPPGHKVGLVGRNGCGKTTLLRAIAGERAVDGGRVVVRNGARVGYLPQTAVSGSTRPLWDEARSRMDRLNALQTALDDATAALGADAASIAAHEQAETAFRLAGGYAIEERVGEVLHGLGFRPEDWRRSCETFSGGWQMRIALARLLLSEPDLLLLDEPTNHLDLHARAWLADWLAASSSTLLLVSHDRHVLDHAADRVVEIAGQRLHFFTGRFSDWLVERQQRHAQALAAYEAQQEEIERLERFVERFRYKATKAKQAQSRQKTLDRMDRLEAPEREPPPRYVLPPAPPSAPVAVELTAASLGWDAPVLRDVELVIERGQRIAVLGPNGGGKSTLLAALAGRLRPEGGRVVRGRDVLLGVFTQDLAQALPTEKTGLDHLLAESPSTLARDARAALGALGLHGDLALRPIGSLSGGEKARVALALFAVRKCNVLLLDEPTNHLDVVTVDVLARALRFWDGAIVFVTHDRFLVEAVATHVAHVQGGQVLLHEGVRADDFLPVDATARETAGAGEGAEAHAERKRRQREHDRLRRRAGEIEAAIEAAEAEIAGVDAALVESGADHEAIAMLARRRAEADARIAALFAEWEAIEADISSR